MQRLGTCEQVPVTVTRIEWVNQPQRTHIPPAPLSDRWHLEIDLSCPDRLVRGAAMLLTDDLLHHTRGWADQPSANVTYRVAVFPHDQDGENGVTVNINTGIAWSATIGTLSTKPQEMVQSLIQLGDRLLTGSVVDLLSFPGIGWTVQVALLVSTDTKNDRTRWHVQKPLGASSPYGFLRTGRRSGWVDLRATMTH